MCAMMPDTDNDDVPMSERFDGVTVDCDDIDGMAEYSVVVTDEQKEELHERQDVQEWVEHVVESHLQYKLRSEDSLISAEARASKVDDFESLSDEHETEYSVWVQFD